MKKKIIDIENKKEYGDKLINDWMTLFQSHSLNNPEYARFTLHTIIGQIFRNIYFRVGARKIDIRTHLLLLQPSGTGKGAGYGISCDFMEKMGRLVAKLTHSTDAGLIGSYQYDPTTKTMEKIDGILKDADFMTMEEANVLFDNVDEHSKKTAIYIQVSCNSIFDTSNEIHKKLLSGDTIKVNPKCSWFLLTYKPNALLETILKTGLIQRFIVVIRDVGFEERKDIINHMFDQLNINTVEDYKEFQQSVFSRLKVVSKYMGGKKKEIKMSNSAKENLRRISLEMSDMILESSLRSREKLEEFIHRFSEHLIRISIHHAILRLSDTVEIIDTAYAKRIMLPIWRRLIAYIEISLIQNAERKMHFNKLVEVTTDAYKTLLKAKEKNIVKKKVWVRRRTLIEECRKGWGDASGLLGFDAAEEYFKEIEKDEKKKNPFAWFEKKKIGPAYYVKMLNNLI